MSLSDLAESSWFESEEYEELPSSSSVVLQHSMVRWWAKVLRRPAVAHLGASQASRRRAVRLLRMAERRNLALLGDVVAVSPSSGSAVPCVSKVSHDLASGDESEDEPLFRRVASYPGFQPSAFDVPSASLESGQEDSSGFEESECEDASEEESETESVDESEDELIYMGRESAMSSFRSQALLSRWVVPVVTAVEI